MEAAKPWWDSASSVSEQLDLLVKDLVANLSLLQIEGRALLTSPECSEDSVAAGICNDQAPTKPVKPATKK